MITDPLRTEVINIRQSDVGFRGRRKYFRKNFKTAFQPGLRGPHRLHLWRRAVRRGVRAFSAETKAQGGTGNSAWVTPGWPVGGGGGLKK